MHAIPICCRHCCPLIIILNGSRSSMYVILLAPRFFALDALHYMVQEGSSEPRSVTSSIPALPCDKAEAFGSQTCNNHSTRFRASGHTRAAGGPCPHRRFYNSGEALQGLPAICTHLRYLQHPSSNHILVSALGVVQKHSVAGRLRSGMQRRTGEVTSAWMPIWTCLWSNTTGLTPR